MQIFNPIVSEVFFPHRGVQMESKVRKVPNKYKGKRRSIVFAPFLTHLKHECDIFFIFASILGLGSTILGLELTSFAILVLITMSITINLFCFDELDNDSECLKFSICIWFSIFVAGKNLEIFFKSVHATPYCLWKYIK